MKRLILLLASITAYSFSYSQSFPVSSIFYNGDDDKRINIVVLSDGYQESELLQFLSDAEGFSNALFNTTPFKEYAAFFNVYAIEVPSTQSGAAHPGTATDVLEPAHPVENVDNYFGSTFDYFDIHRLLVPTNSSAAFSVLGVNFPAYDQPVILVNSPYYGGSGGFLATASTDPSSNEVAIHEIGHSFAGLADEYYAGDFYASEKDNMTMESDPGLVKWNNWVGINEVGVFQHCCGDNSDAWYRPHEDCKMRYLGTPFCSVCTESFINRIYSLVTPIDDYSPTNLTVEYTGTPLDFFLTLILPNPNTLDVEWILNGNTIEQGLSSVTINGTNLLPGSNQLTARVVDNTLLSKTYPNGYEFFIEWTINNSGNPPCAFDLLLTQPIANTTIYEASNSITASNEILPTADVLYQAGQLITLQAGFHAQSGCQFHALMQDCAISPAPRSVSSLVAEIENQQAEPSILSVFPTPTNGITTIAYSLPTEQNVSIDLFDLHGTLVQQVLPIQSATAGYYQVELNSEQLPHGTYFVRLIGKHLSKVTKLVVVK